MLVSVIIPTFNRASMLKEAIDSVLVQNYKDFELIIIDDGSTDSTREVVSGYGEALQYVYQENSGVSSARNAGIERSSGELIAFLDSDDLWMPDKLKYQVDFFESNSDISICQTEEVWTRNEKRVNPRNVHKKHSGWIFEKCVPLCIVSPSAVMIRRFLLDDVGLFDEEMPACEDYDLWLRIALKYQIVTLPEAKIVKRGGHEDQLSKMWGLDIWRIYALKKVLGSKGLSFEQEILVREDIKRRSAIISQGARKRGKLELAKEYEEL